MRDIVMKQFITHASSESGPLSILAMQAVRGEAVDYAVLRKKIEKAGYLVKHTPKTNGAWIRIFRNDPFPSVVAEGYSGSEEDAFLHAVFGACREEDAAAAVATWLTRAKIEVDEALRKKLEERYITQGGLATLRRDIEHMQALSKPKAVTGGMAILALLCMLGMASVSLAATASWDAVSDPELQGYNLYRAQGICATPGAFAKVQIYGVVTSGAVQNPSTNGTYCHRLTAFNAAGESPFSNTVELKYTVVPPSAPQNFSVKP